MDVFLEGVGYLLLAFLLTLILMQGFVATSVMARILQVTSILFHKFSFDVLWGVLAASSSNLGMHRASICGRLIQHFL